MNDDFASLWRAQPLAEHDIKRLTKTLHKQRLLNMLANSLNGLCVPPALWFAYYVATDDVHWAVKIFVMFCMLFGTGMTLLALKWSRQSMRQIQESSNQAYVDRLKQQTQNNLRMCRAHVVNAYVLTLGYVLFLVLYVTTSAQDTIEWKNLGLATAAVAVIIMVSWIYGKTSGKKFTREQQWLDSLQP